jgi:hypothetical protein
MISLMNLVLEDIYETGQVWITKKRYYGAKNTFGDIRYFMDREDATAFAAGNIEGPEPGRPEPKQHVQHHEPKQKYSSE